MYEIVQGDKKYTVTFNKGVPSLLLRDLREGFPHSRRIIVNVPTVLPSIENYMNYLIGNQDVVVRDLYDEFQVGMFFIDSEVIYENPYDNTQVVSSFLGDMEKFLLQETSLKEEKIERLPLIVKEYLEEINIIPPQNGREKNQIKMIKWLLKKPGKRSFKYKNFEYIISPHINYVEGVKEEPFPFPSSISGLPEPENLPTIFVREYVQDRTDPVESIATNYSYEGGKFYILTEKEYRDKVTVESELKFVFLDGSTVNSYHWKQVENKFDGNYKTWYLNGKLRQNCNYSHGKLEGKFELWHEDGTLDTIGFYKDDKLEGKYETSGEDGDRYVYHYINGLLNGPSEKWYQSGRREELSYYKNGSLIGDVISWYDNEEGQIESINTYIDDDTIIYQAWYENGKRKIISNYVNNNLNGPYQEWYPNGNLKRISNYVDDKLNGKEETWYEDGARKTESNFVEGKLEGKYREWYPNGEDKEITIFSNEELDYVSTTWYANRQMKKYVVSYNGQLVEELYYDENGQQLQFPPE